MILVDSNIPMYLVGTPSPHKTDAQRILEKIISQRERLVTDTEVLQEILHGYVAINRRRDIQPAFDVLLNVVDEVFSVNLEWWNELNRSYSLMIDSRRGTQFIWP